MAFGCEKSRRRQETMKIIPFKKRIQKYTPQTPRNIGTCLVIKKLNLEGLVDCTIIIATSRPHEFLFYSRELAEQAFEDEGPSRKFRMLPASDAKHVKQMTPIHTSRPS